MNRPRAHRSNLNGKCGNGKEASDTDDTVLGRSTSVCHRGNSGRGGVLGGWSLGSRGRATDSAGECARAVGDGEGLVCGGSVELAAVGEGGGLWAVGCKGSDDVGHDRGAGGRGGGVALERAQRGAVVERVVAEAGGVLGCAVGVVGIRCDGACVESGCAGGRGVGDGGVRVGCCHGGEAEDCGSVLHC